MDGEYFLSLLPDLSHVNFQQDLLRAVFRSSDTALVDLTKGVGSENDTVISNKLSPFLRCDNS